MPGLSHGISVLDARPDELDQVARLILAANEEYADRLPPGVWEMYSRNIQDVRGRSEESDLIVAEDAGGLVGTVTFYPSRER